MAYFNKKAQSLTELSAFGSILLLVLSFLISYGMRYNYQQEIQMRAFRTAMSEAYKADRPDASASVELIEDRHIPDPRDMFGVGNITPIQGNAEVTWGNTMQEKYDTLDDSLLPRRKYIINDRNADADKVEREYKTAGYRFITKGTNFYVILPGQTEPQIVAWSNVKCYQPTPDSPKQAMVLLANYDKDVITEVYLKPAGAAEDAKRYVKYQVVGVRTDPPVPLDGYDGKPIDRLEVLSPDSGQIDPNYMQLNNDVDMDGNPDVTPANVQGLLADTEQQINRSGTLTIETPGSDKSASTYSFKDKSGNPTTITHKIRSISAGVENINSTFKRDK